MFSGVFLCASAITEERERERERERTKDTKERGRTKDFEMTSCIDGATGKYNCNLFMKLIIYLSLWIALEFIVIYI